MVGIRVVLWWTPHDIPPHHLLALSLSLVSPSSGQLLIWSASLSTGVMIHVVSAGLHSPHTDTAQSCSSLSMCPSVSSCSPPLSALRHVNLLSTCKLYSSALLLLLSTSCSSDSNRCNFAFPTFSYGWRSKLIFLIFLYCGKILRFSKIRDLWTLSV